jgi:hypothetical protein
MANMQAVRSISVPSRHLEQVYRLLGIKPDWSGFFSGRYSGYKTMGRANELVFSFYPHPKIRVRKAQFVTVEEARKGITRKGR